MKLHLLFSLLFFGFLSASDKTLPKDKEQPRSGSLQDLLIKRKQQDSTAAANQKSEIEKKDSTDCTTEENLAAAGIKTTAERKKPKGWRIKLAQMQAAANAKIEKKRIEEEKTNEEEKQKRRAALASKSMVGFPTGTHNTSQKSNKGGLKFLQPENATAVNTHDHAQPATTTKGHRRSDSCSLSVSELKNLGNPNNSSAEETNIQTKGGTNKTSLSAGNYYVVMG